MHLLLASLLLVHLAAATDISLSSFTPRIDNLPSACRAVYTTPIDGCAASDFAVGATCSVQCLAGMVRIGVSVKTGCSGVDVGETSIIGVFQNGLGVAALCPNNKQPTTTSTAASQTSTSTKTEASSSLQTRTSSSAQATTAAPPSSSAQSTSPSSSAASSSGGIAIDSTASQAASTTFRFNDPTAAPTSTGTPAGNSQLSNSDSGGGSPFDVVATGAAGRLQGTWLALGVVAAMVLFAGCL